MAWEIIHDVPFERIRRMAIQGGYLYQVEIDEHQEVMHDGEPSVRRIGWHPPVFVPR